MVGFEGAEANGYNKHLLDRFAKTQDRIIPRELDSTESAFTSKMFFETKNNGFARTTEGPEKYCEKLTNVILKNEIGKIFSCSWRQVEGLKSKNNLSLTITELGHDPSRVLIFTKSLDSDGEKGTTVKFYDLTESSRPVGNGAARVMMDEVNHAQYDEEMTNLYRTREEENARRNTKKDIRITVGTAMKKGAPSKTFTYNSHVA